MRVRLRTLALYATGVALSVAAILIVSTLSGLATRRVEEELDRLLLDGVQVRFSSLNGDTAEDALRDAARGLRQTPLPVVALTGTAQGRACAVWGVGSCGVERFSLRFCAGRFFSRWEEDAAARVCVIGETAAEALFGITQAVGAPLRLAVGPVEETFRVVGVFADGYAARMMNVAAEIVYVPCSVVEQAAGGRAERAYWLSAEPGLTQAAVRLKDRLGDDCQITDYTGQRTQIRKVFGLVSGILTWISSVSLLVAAFNLRVVTQIRLKGQLREIGLKKSIGATDGDLLWESVFEAGWIALLGALIGVGIDGVLCLILRLTGEEAPFPFAVAGGVTAAAVALSVLFSLIPAWRAARLPPAMTLRQNG